jgi:hypothetical protein
MDLVKDSHEALRDRIWRAMTEDLGDEAYSFDVVHVFESAAIVRDYSTGTFLKLAFTDDGQETRLGEISAVEQAYVVTEISAATGKAAEEVQKALRGFGAARLTAPIVSKAIEQRIAYGPVLVPDEPDSDGDVVGAAKIEEVAHKFLRDYGNIDLQHSLNVVARPVESYIAPVDLAFGDSIVPKGAWIMGVFIEDDDTWEAVKSGGLTGFSIMGVRKTEAGDVASLKAADAHRVTLADLGDDWVIPFVSVVSTPAVPKAKFMVIKSKPRPGLLEKIRVALRPAVAEKVGRRFSDDTYGTLKTAVEALSALLSEADKERSSEKSIGEQQRREDDVDETKVQEIVAEALKPISEAIDAGLKSITERVDALDAAAKAEPPATEEPEVTAGPSQEDFEALKSQVETLTSDLAEANEFRSQVEKRFGKTETRSIKEQDGSEDEDADKEAALKSQMNGRDGYGRRIRD